MCCKSEQESDFFVRLMHCDKRSREYDDPSLGIVQWTMREIFPDRAGPSGLIKNQTEFIDWNQGTITLQEEHLNTMETG